MTDTLDTYLTEANNMGRVVHQARVLGGLIEGVANMVSDLHRRMRSVADQQAAYIRALDNDTIKSATITFNVKEQGESIPTIPIMDDKIFRGMMVEKAKAYSATLNQYHEKLLEMEILIQHMEPMLREFYERIKSLKDLADQPIPPS